MMDALRFYENARDEVDRRGYEKEAEYVNSLRFEQLTAYGFFWAYVFVVLSSGMKNQVAERIYTRFRHSGLDFSCIGHPGKQKAIRRASMEYPRWCDELAKAEDRLEYLETLPWIGPITKYHLARNIGLDVAKPDRHLVRLAERFNFADVHSMCQSISEKTGDRIGVVDVILWRYCNLTGGSR